MANLGHWNFVHNVCMFIYIYKTEDTIMARLAAIGDFQRWQLFNTCPMPVFQMSVIYLVYTKLKNFSFLLELTQL